MTDTRTNTARRTASILTILTAAAFCFMSGSAEGQILTIPGGGNDGHSDEVRSVAWSPDGTKIVSGSKDDTVKIWNASTGALIRTINGHTDEVHSVAWSPDGTKIFSGSRDRSAKVWNASTGALIRSLSHTQTVNSVAWSPDGKKIFSVDNLIDIKIWNASTGQLNYTGTGAGSKVSVNHNGTKFAGTYLGGVGIWNIPTSGNPSKAYDLTVNNVRQTDFNHDGTRLVSGSSGTEAANQKIKIWNLSVSTPTALHTLTHGGQVFSVDFSPDGTWIASGSSEDTVKMWNAATGVLIKTLSGHTDDVMSVAFSPDGTKIASGSKDNSVKIWNAEVPHTDVVYSVDYSPDGTRIVSGSADNTVKIWNAYDITAPIATLRGHTGKVRSVAYNHNGTRIASGGNDNTVKIWNASTGALIRTITDHAGVVLSVAFNHNGTRLASGSSDDTVKIWNASTGALIRTIRHSNDVYSVAFSHDGARIASGASASVKIWNASTGAEVHTLSISNVFSVAYNHDSTKLLTCNVTDSVVIWDVSLATPDELHTLTHTSLPNFAAWSPDGTKVASGHLDNVIKMWNASTGTLISTLTGHAGSVRGVDFSPDGARLVSGSDDDTIRLWDVPEIISSHTDDVYSVAWSPDGTEIVSGDNDNAVKIWNASTGAEIRAMTGGHTSLVNSVAYNHDGTKIASGSADDTVKIWNASTGNNLHTLPKTGDTGHANDVISVAYNHDGTRIVSASRNDYAIKIWNASTGALLHTLPGAGIVAVFNHDGTKIAAGKDTGLQNPGIQIWDVSTSTPTKLRDLPSRGVMASLAFNHDGTKLVSGYLTSIQTYKKVNIWDLSTSTPTALHTLAHGSAVNSVDFSPDGALVASGGADNAIKIWNASTGGLIQTIAAHTDAVNSVAFSPDGKKLASGSDDNTVRVWRIVLPKDPTFPTDSTDSPVVIDPYRTNLESIRFSSDGTKLINARLTGYVDLWDVDLTAKRAALSKSLKQGQHWVLDGDLSPDGKQIVSAGSNIVLQISDAENGLIAHTLKGHTDWTTAAVYSPDGSLIASGSQDNTARLWNASTGALVHTLTGHTGTVGAVSFSSDGALLATGSEDNTARLYYVSTGALAQTLKGHGGAVRAVAVSPSNNMLATASEDGKARIYNVTTGALLHTLEGHTGAATAVLFSPNGASLVTGDAGGTRRVWSVGTGKLQATYGGATDPLSTGALTDPGNSRHRGSVRALTFTADGKTLISCGSWVDVLMQELEIGDPPTVTITGPTDAVDGSFDATITFSKAVTGFEASDITVTNGSVSSLTGSGAVYTAAIALTPLFEGAVTVSIPAGAAQSADKEDSLAASFEATVDLGDPTANIAGPEGPIGTGAFEITIAFNQNVTGLEASDLAVAGGTAAEPTGSGAAYAVSITPNADAEKATVSLPAGSVQNADGDMNEASNTYEIAIDSDSPTAAVTGPEGPVNGAPFDVSVAFSEEVTGFDADDVSVEGGTAASVEGSGMAYTVSIDPDDDFEGTLTVSIAAGAAADDVGNGSQASNVYEVQVDQTAPTVSIEGPSGPLGPAPLNLTITFSESVNGFASSDVAVVGGSAKASGKGMDYAVEITPADDFQGVLTVSIGADAAQDSAGNGNAASDAYSVEIVRSTSFTVNLRQGLNMLHVPVNDARAERLSGLYNVLGGFQDVEFLLAYSRESGRFIAYVDSLAGSSSDLPLADGTAVIASMRNAKAVTFTGGLLTPEVPLRVGINLIGVTRIGSIETIGDLAALSTDSLLVLALQVDDAGNALFADSTDSTAAAKGAEGYIVFAEAETVLTFDGGAWKNDAASTAAPLAAYDPSSTPLLVVEGSVAREDNLTPLNGLEVSITNLQTGQTASDLAGRSSVSGRFSLPLLALTGDSYAVGDAFDLRVSDSSGRFGGVRTVRIVLDKETASSGRIDIGQLLATAVPTESSLLPNYPNPFNPETWIPFDLSEASRVTITIYNAAGQTVRALELGQLPAGAYRSRSKAAHWDGRNALGEPTASGIYYVRIEAGSFSAMRRMVVLK